MENLNYTYATKEIQEKVNYLKGLINDGGKFGGATIIANTSASLMPKKDGCPYGKKDDVRKDTEYSVDLNGKYADKINRVRASENKDENFVPKKNWHVKLFDTINGSIVAKRSEVENGLPITEIYLLCAVRFAKSNNYTIQGVKATESEIETIKKFTKNRKVEASKSQGVSQENGHIVTTIASSNFIKIKANKEVVEF